jgi:glutaredoxin 2
MQISYLVLDKLHMGLQGISGQAKLDELLLFHQLRVGTVVHNVLAKNRIAEWAIDFLSIDVRLFAIEDEIITRHA